MSVLNWTSGLLTYQGTTYEIAADSTDKKYIYWDPNYTTMFRDTDSLQDVFDCDGFLMCINDSGTPYPAYNLPVIHGGVIQAGTLVVGTADIENLAVTTAKINNLAVETLKIANNAVTYPVSSYTAGLVTISTSWVTLASVSITSTGASLFLSFSCIFVKGNLTDVDIRIRRVATDIYTAFHDLTAMVTIPFASCLTDQPSSGSYTYYFQARRNGVNNLQARNRSLFVIETKK